jgi:SAM-dependent methyltransferase
MFAVVATIGITVIMLVVLGLLLTFALYQSSRTRIGYIPLPTRAVPKVVKALNLTGSATVFDLGCGDGRILGAALQETPTATGVGIEYHPMVAWLARWRTRHIDSRRLRIIRGDILHQDLNSATRLFAYLNHPTMALLEPKLKQELKPGARLVSCDFPLPHTKPTKAVKIGESWQLGQTLYIYEY